MMQCKSMQDKQDDEQMETDLQAIPVHMTPGTGHGAH
jgi:hypothetical protein